MLAEIYQPASEAELGFCATFFSLLKEKSGMQHSYPDKGFHYINIAPIFPKDVQPTKMLLDFQFSGNL